MKKYNNIIVSLDNEFGRRFADYQQLNEELDIVLSPLTFNTENAPGNLQLELIKLQRDSIPKEKFNTKRIDRFYALLNKSKFVILKKMAMKLLVLFYSTYIREQTFSTMNLNKSKLP